MSPIKIYILVFQSTLPRRERPVREWQESHPAGFQSTLPRRERQFIKVSGVWGVSHFNPHSHEGSDRSSDHLLLQLQYFNPHSHEGSDIFVRSGIMSLSEFQSTLPRRERLPDPKILLVHFYFNPHSHEGSDSNINQ